MIEIETNIYKDALDKFGVKPQMMMLIEEMSELTQAISKFGRGKDHNIEEEIADVEIMLGQMRLVFDEEMIEEYKVIKLAKLNKLLRGESNE